MFDMKIYVIGVFQKDNEVEIIHYAEGSTFSYERKEQAKHLEKDGYKLVSSVITSDRKLFRKKMLDVRLFNLKDLVRHNMEYIKELEDRNTSQEVIDETIKIQKELEESAMKLVALAVNRCLRFDIEVTDELALMCKDYRDNVIRAEENYMKAYDMV